MKMKIEIRNFSRSFTSSDSTDTDQKIVQMISKIFNSTLSEVAAPQPAGRGQGLLRREGEARGEEGGHQEDPLTLRVHSSLSSSP